MYNVDMHMIEIGSGSVQNAIITDTWSKRQNNPAPDTSFGSNDDLTNISTTNDANGNNIIKYRRKLDTSDAYDYKIINGANVIEASWGPSQVGKHGAYVVVTTMTVDIANQTISFSGQGRWIIFEIHGISLIIAWSFLNLVGYVSARLLKHLPFWIWIHRLGSGLTGLTTIVFGLMLVVKG